MKTLQLNRGRGRSFLMVLLVITTLSFTVIPVEIQKLTAEKNHSSLLFSVPIANGITRVTGKFNDYSIDLDFVDKDFTKSTLSATIEVAGIDTGIPGRDEHLRSADFFEAETYPRITFVSKRIERSADGYVAIGDLTMKGISKETEIPFVVTGADGENTIGIAARFSLNRTDFGVGNDFQHSSIENFISETISVEIDFWTKKRKEPKKAE